MPPRTNYTPPSKVESAGLWELVRGARAAPERAPRLFEDSDREAGPTVWYAGDRDLATRPCVAIVGSRQASPEGRQRAGRLARELVEAGIVVVSGLAEGIDRAAHDATIAAGGRTIAVVGTPVDRAYPAAHAQLQERIYREHLLVSPFRVGAQVFKSNFPIRNRVMAGMTDATVIIEAGETSGTLHQAAECGPQRMNRWLLIARSLVDRKDLTWPAKFLDAAKRGAHVKVLEKTADVLEVLQKCPS